MSVEKRLVQLLYTQVGVTPWSSVLPPATTVKRKVKGQEVKSIIIIITSLKAVADGPVGQVLAGPLFVKVKTKFHFTKSKQ